MTFGIDLGTTNSSIAWADPEGVVHSLRLRRGPRDPFDAVEKSLVAYPLHDEPVVGQSAITAQQTGQHVRLVSSFKRRLDKQRLREERRQQVTRPTGDYDPVAQGMRFEDSYEIVALYDEYSLAEVVSAASCLLGRLMRVDKRDSNVAPEYDLRSLAASEDDEFVYIGVPVSFGPTARRRLLWALVDSECFGSDAGAYRRALDRCRFVYEPLALTADIPLFESQRVLVFDYGGGTLDLAVLDVLIDDRGQVVRELALGSLDRAGDHLDAIFREHVLRTRPSLRAKYEAQVDSSSDFDRYRADTQFANVKIRLSTEEEAVLPLFRDSVTRGELEAALESEVDCCIAEIENTLARAGVAATEITHVYLTGGSSLIPMLQRRIRAQFPDLDDDRWSAPDPANQTDELKALTGVSRGLARFGFLEGFEAGAPCNYSVVTAGSDGPVVCLPRGLKSQFELHEAPPTRIVVPRSGAGGFALQSDLLRDAYCGGIVNVWFASDSQEVDVRVSASRDRISPAFGVYEAGTTSEIASFDLHALSARELKEFVQGDSDWLPIGEAPRVMFLTRPLAVGDYVEWQANGATQLGQVVGIRHLDTGEEVAEMGGLDPSPYVFTVASEVDGTVVRGHTTRPRWGVGDVCLA